MAKRARLIDKGKANGYWSRIIERASRAFENYTIGKMQDEGYHNDYLANVVASPDFARDISRYPYLLEDELTPVSQAFDDLFGTIKTRKTEKGVELYSKATQPLPKSQQEDVLPALEKSLSKKTIRNLIDSGKLRIISQGQLQAVVADDGAMLSRGMVNLDEVKGYWSDKDIEYLKNPTEQELIAYLQQVKMEQIEQGVRGDFDVLRYVIDEETGDAYFYDSIPIDHNGMSEALKIEKGDSGFVKSEGHIKAMIGDSYFRDNYTGWKNSVLVKQNIKYSKDGRIEAFYDPKTDVITLVQGNIKVGESKQVLAHEIGHSILGDVFQGKQWNNLLDSFNRHKGRDTETGKAIDKAIDRVPKDTKPEDVTSEIVSYFLTNTSNQNLPLYKRIMAYIRTALRKLGFSAVHPDDVRLAVEAHIKKLEGKGRGVGVVGKGLAEIREFAQPVGMAFSKAKKAITDNPAFNAWFGESKVLGEDGEPLVAYHGTDDSFTIFDITKGRKWAAKVGFWFTSDKGLADIYGENVMPVYLSITNPKVISQEMFDGWREEHFDNESFWQAKTEEFKKQGHDGIKIVGEEEVFGGVVMPAKDTFVAFGQGQIKSIYNRGTFDPATPDIMKSVAEPIKFSKAQDEMTTEELSAQQKAITNEVKLNPTIDGVTSDASLKKGIAIVKAMYKELYDTSTPSVSKRYEQTAVEKTLTSLNKVMAEISNPLLSIKQKQQFVATFAKKLPQEIRKELLVPLKNISTVKTDKALKRKVNIFLGKAKLALTENLKAKMIGKMEKKTEELKKRKGKKHGRGRELERDLKFIRNSFDITDVNERIETLETRLMNLNTQLQAGQDVQERIDKTESKLNYLTIFGDLQSKAPSQLASAERTLTDLLKVGRAKWQAQKEALRERNTRNATKVNQEVTSQENPVPEDSNEKKRREAKEKKSIKRKFWSVKEFFSNGIASWQTTLDKITPGLKVLGSWTVDHFGSLGHKGTSDEAKFNIDEIQTIADKSHEIFGDDVNEIFAKADVPVDDKVFTYKDGKKSAMPISEMEAAYWYLIARGRSEDAAIQKTFDAQGITEETLAQINELITPEMKQYADWLMDDYLQQFYHKVNAVYSLMEGIDLEHRVNYITIKREVNHKIDDASTDMSFHEMQVAGLGKKGSLISRVMNTNNFRAMNLNQVVMDHVTDMNNYRAWALPTQEINGVFNRTETKNYITQYHGENVLSTIQKFQEDFTKSTQKRFDDLGALDTLRSAITISMVGANPVVVMKQLTSVPAFAASIPLKDWVAGTAYASSHPLETWTILKENSPLFVDRGQGGYDKETMVARQADASRTISQKKKLKDWAMAGVQFGDQFAITAGGWAVYDYHRKQALKAGKSWQEAKGIGIFKFEQAFSESQQSRSTAYRGWMLRGGSGANLFTMFLTAPASYSRNIELGTRHLKDDPKTAVKYLTIYAVILPMVFQAVADAMLGWDDDEDEKEEFWLHQKRAIQGSLLNGYPIVREMQKMAVNTVDGNMWWDTPLTPMEALPKELVKSLDSLMKWKEGGTAQKEPEEYRDAFLTHFTHALGHGFGIPTKPLERWGKGVRDVARGESKRPVRALLGYSEAARGEKSDDEIYKSTAKKIRDLRAEYKDADPEDRAELRSSPYFKYRALEKSTSTKLRKAKARLKRMKVAKANTAAIDAKIARIKATFVSRVVITQ